jgi:ribonuclease D
VTDLIARPEAFEALCASLRRAGRFGLDLEFVREKSYFPRICLIQIAADGAEALVDPLAELDLEPLRALMLDPGVVKILHAGGQDLELLMKEAPPRGVFDTQIAGSFLGMGDAIGYAELCRRELGVSVPKAGQVADWERRPLSPKLLRYAAGDVAHLPALYERLSERLRAQGRLAWAAEEFARLEDRSVAAPMETWKRVKGGGSLEGRERAVLACLAEWREREAAARNQPRQRILNDRTLLELARQAPAHVGALHVSRFFPPDKIKRYGDAILRAIAEGRALPESRWPRRDAAAGRSIVPAATLDLLNVLVKHRCDELGIGPARLATRDDVAEFATQVARGGSGEARLLRGWRWACVGQDLAALLAGKLSLRVRGRSVEVVRTEGATTTRRLKR